MSFLGNSSGLIRFGKVDFSMTKRTVLQLEIVKFTLKCLVFASLASIVLLGENTLATCDARREMTATFSAVDVANISMK